MDYRHHLLTDSSRIRQDLSYAEPVPIPEALSRTIAWELANPPDKVDLKRFDYAAEDEVLAGLEPGDYRTL